MSKNDIEKQEALIKFKIKKIIYPIDIEVEKLLDSYVNMNQTDSSSTNKVSAQLNFSMGVGYIQHIPEIFNRVQREFLDLCYEVTQNKVYLGDVHRQGIIGRYIEDTIFSKYWYTFHCTDEKYRQWGQPYFAINMDKGRQVCLNDIPTIKEKMREIKLNEL